MKKRPKICLALNCKTIEELKAEIDEYGQYCSCIEWNADRFIGIDSYSGEEFAQLLRLVKTMCGDREFFFDYKGEEEKVNKYLRYAMGVADYINIAWGNSQTRQLVKEARRKKTQTMLSYYVLDKIMTSEDISTQLIQMELFQADLLKVVAFANTEADAYALLEGAYGYNQLKSHQPFVVIAMGSEGQASRICSGDFGSVMTYGCGSKPTAPGQFDVKDLCRYMDTYYKGKAEASRGETGKSVAAKKEKSKVKKGNL